MSGPVRATGFLERWLQAHGVAPAQVADAAAAARARAARYPFPVDRAFPLAERFFDRVAPALLLGTTRPAHALSDEAFDQLEHGLQQGPNLLLRAVYTLARYPAFDALYQDARPDRPWSHPLQGLEARIRASTSYGRDYDVIVIGSGAGGAPVAWSLARRGLRVAIVEAGELVTPATSGDAIERYYVNQGITGSLARGGMTLLLAGEALGGTTVINSGTSLPPLGECLHGWDAALGTRFAQGELDPWLEEAARLAGVTPMRRELLDASAALVERGLAALGRPAPFVLPRNAPACEGNGRCCFGCPVGAKLSTDRAFLPGAVEAGAALFAGARATELRERADGVEVFLTGRQGRRRLRARRLVIAAGALGTPALLRQARLGARWRQAGDGLRIHPASKVFAMFPDALHAPGERPGIPQGLGFKAPELPRVTFEGVHTPAAAAAPMVAAAGRRHRAWMDRYEHLATFGMMVRDRRPGSVRRAAGQTLVQYALDPEDARDLGAGLLLVSEAMFAAGAERVLLPVAGMPPEVESLDELRALRPEDFTPERLLTCGFHPQGTAGMGRVVGADLRLLGSEHVYVCDASVLPDSPGVNPQVTIMALALRCAEHLALGLER
ncbi:MAG: FAD-dependent oxidoreductase [Planctomycetota bacterium]